MNTLIELSKSLIKIHEGLENFVYKDSRGLYTIGYGRNVDKNGGLGISDSEADILLSNDLIRMQNEAVSHIPIFYELCLARQAVVMDMLMMGLTHFLKFKKFLIDLNNKDYESASLEIINSEISNNRKKNLSLIMSSGSINKI